MNVFVARLRDGRGRRGNGSQVIWVAYDGFNLLRGRTDEDKAGLLMRWRAAHGATRKVVTVKDECLPSDVALHRAELALLTTSQD